MQRRVGLAHGAADVVQRRLVFFPRRIQHGGHAFDLRGIAAVFVADGDRPHFGGGGRDPPAATVALQQQVDQAHMAAPEPAHDGGRPVDCPRRRVDPLDAFVIGAGEDAVMVPGQHGVDAGNRGQRNARILHHLARRGLADAAVRQRDHEIRALLPHPRHVGPGGGEDVARAHVALQVATIPRHDLRRREADDADADRVRLPRAVGQLAVEDDIGRHQRRIVRGRGPLLGDDVGQHHGKLRPGQRLGQEIEAVIELVVAQRGGIEPDRIHRRDHRVQVTLLQPAFIGHEVAQRVALQEVAVVEDDGIARLGADLLDERGGAGQAHGVDRLVRVIIVGPDMDMQVRRLGDAKMGLVRLRARGEGMDDDQGGSGGRGQEMAAGERHDELRCGR